jgi:nucleotide-binding universal stress UspA family protein
LLTETNRYKRAGAVSKRPHEELAMTETPVSGPEALSARAGGTRVQMRVRPGRRWTSGEPAQQPSEPDWQPGRPGWPGSEPSRPPGGNAGPEWSEEGQPRGDQWQSGQQQRGQRRDDGGFLHPVLVGYDGSEPSCHALAYAAGMARRLDRNLVVLYCTQTRLPSAGGFPFMPLTAATCLPDSDAGGDHLDWLKAELTEAADLDGLRVRVIERDGDPARELACAATEYNTDAVVIGAPRRFLHRFAGSVPAWLARHARCPVVVVP